MNKITQYLNQHTAGNVFDRLPIREAYATDRSILRMVPRFVAMPEDTGDVCKLLRFSNRLAERNFKLPVGVCGHQHDKTGAAITTGLLISMEKMNVIQELDVRGRLVRVQAGVTLGDLNAVLESQGLTLPIKADPERTIGGLIAGAVSDNYAGKYGGIYNYIDRLEVALPSGDLIQTDNLSKRALKRRETQDTAEGRLYADLDDAFTEQAETLAKLREGSFDAAGYAAASLVKVKRTFDLLPIFLGSQGTLGVITEVILRCELMASEPQHLLAEFKTMRRALDFMQFARELDPLEINFYDNRILQAAEACGKKPALLSGKVKPGFTVLASFNDTPRRARRKIKKCANALAETSFYAVAQDKENALDFLDFHNAVASFLNDNLRGERAPVVDDAEVPDDKLTNFVTHLKDLEKELCVELPLYGSFLARNYSVRPELQLETVAGRQFALHLLKKYTKLLQDHHGTITGGSAEGRIKAMVTKFSPEEKKLYTAIKKAFDPQEILNPNVKLVSDPRTTIRHMRASYMPQITTE